MASTRRFFVTSFLAFAVACSGGGGDSGDPDCTGEACEPTRPRVVATTPAAGATAVPVLSNVTVTFSEPIDPSTISASTVRLSRPDPRGPDEVPVALSYDDATRTLTIEPLGALDHAKLHTVSLAGLRGASGEAVEATTFSFRTTVNGELRSVNYFGDGLVAGYVVYERDDAGVLLRSAVYAGAGPDGRWYTADDVLNSYQVGTFLDAPRRIEYLRVVGPGADGVWYTADDSVAARWANELDENGDVIGSHTWAAGPDGLMNTPDDVLAGRRVDVRNAAGDTVREVHFDHAGADGIWGTEDDRVQTYTVHVYDGAGRNVRSIGYSSAGTDGRWFTADDLVDYWQENTFVPEHPHLYAATRTLGAPGPDSLWFTEDDLVTGYSDATYDARGRMLTRASHVGPGADGDWSTREDNALSSWTRFIYDSAGERVGSAMYNDPGADGTWFTDDDVLSRAATHETGR